VYLIIPKRAAYAQPVIIRGRELSINRLLITNHYIFGPFQGVRELNELLKIIRRAIPFSFGKCRPLGGQPCFDYQIGLCPGACLGAITSQDYQKNIRNLVLLFSGKKQAVLKNLKKQNPDKAKMLQRLQDVSLLTNNQLPITNHQFERIEAYDISHFGGKNTYGAMSVAINGELTKDQYRLFKTRNAPQNDDLRALQETLERRLNHKEWAYPDLILVDGGIPQVRHIYGLLRSLKVGTPLVGISKINGDKLVFPPGLSKLKHGQIKGIRGLLLLLRNEAHRFGNRARKHSGGV
jgi:excinuclease ABC subunit C